MGLLAGAINVSADTSLLNAPNFPIYLEMEHCIDGSVYYSTVVVLNADNSVDTNNWLSGTWDYSGSPEKAMTFEFDGSCNPIYTGTVGAGLKISDTRACPDGSKTGTWRARPVSSSPAL